MPLKFPKLRRGTDSSPVANATADIAPPQPDQPPPDFRERRRGTSRDAGARTRLGDGLGTLGFEIVDIAALLQLVDSQARDVESGLRDLRGGADDIEQALTAASAAVSEVRDAADGSVDQARDSMERMKQTGAHSQRVAEWVGALGARIASIEDRLAAVERSTDRIGDIAAEVGILAINARIVAARAGEHGKGFAVVADAISELAQQTSDVTTGISSDVAAFSGAVTAIRDEAATVVVDADHVLKSGQSTDAALTAIGGHLETTQRGVARLGEDLGILTRANEAFRPVLNRLGTGIEQTGTQVHDGHARVEALIDLVETLVQNHAAVGGTTDDAALIAEVQARAAQVAEAFADALISNRITEADLFDTAYTPIAGTNPAQVTTRFVALTDQILPPIQEPAFEIDPRVVFCAAVDRNGYLPTHNRKFSKPQTQDPVWNAANCRNRRIFDDRVGLKAGRNKEPFLLQVYRRDMGGGDIVLMKDLSAPIVVNGRHWGGLRLAYRPT